jgi:CMP-N,N'-diacetyllegionaminic acid synthase
MMIPPSILALIPARGGSKGIPRKNVIPVAGKPLVVHSIEQALAARHVMQVVVSTDDDEIAQISSAAGASVVRRPSDISGDKASSESALVHALGEFAASEAGLPDLVVFLQCTSPLRQPGDIDAAIDKLLSEGADSLLSVSPSHRFLWAEVDGKATSLNYDFRLRPRRQDMPAQYVENGSIYVFRPAILLEGGNRLGGKVALHVMDEDSSWDIDTRFDMRVAEMLMMERIGA